MEKEKFMIDILERFGVSISGISQAERDLKSLKKSWFATFKKKFERDALEQIIPKLEKLDEEFKKKMRDLLDKEGKKFLNSFEEQLQ